jgi:5-methylcytosine-specific restriction endonuclease McrA
MKVNGKTVGTTYLTRYCKSRLGYASKEKVKLYDLVCMALEVDGMPLPLDISSKQWVEQNIEHIVGRNKFEKLKSCSVQGVKAKKIKAYSVPRSAAGIDVTSDAFLSTFQWRKVRMEALKKYGPKCMCCGATPATGAVMNVDHIKPRKKWPSLALDVNNLQILCHDCNHGKGNWDQTDWR